MDRNLRWWMQTLVLLVIAGITGALLGKLLGFDPDFLLGYATATIVTYRAQSYRASQVQS